MKRTLAAALTALTLPVFALTVAPPAEAHRTGIHDNCARFNAKWPNGVGLRRAVDLGPPASKRVTNFVRAPKKYRKAVRHNRRLDRDKDGIACEKLSRRPAAAPQSPVKPPTAPPPKPHQPAPQQPPKPPPPPPQPAQSIDIATRSVIAYGSRLDDTPNFVFRPTFMIAAEVVCPKGLAGFMRVPVHAHTAPGAEFTCEGTSQMVYFGSAAAPSTPGAAVVPVTVTLVTARGEVSDTQRIAITTRFSD